MIIRVMVRIIHNIGQAVQYLANGGLLSMATDTLFALSCDATNPSSIERLYQVKMRDKEKKLPVFFYNLDHVMEYCYISDRVLDIAKKFWPGKLTIILDIKSQKLNILGATIAVRIPGCDQILEIIQRLNRPIIGTSANISGCNNLNTFAEVERSFYGSEIAIFKNNRIISGTQSTIIHIEKDQTHIIREGAISSEEILSMT